jgi:hypothetical protein
VELYKSSTDYSIEDIQVDLRMRLWSWKLLCFVTLSGTWVHQTSGWAP